MSELTFQIAQPIRWRPATCAEVRCDFWLRGGRTAVDERTPLGERQAEYLRARSGRRKTERRDESGLTVFEFAPGQECFASGEHRVPAERREQAFRVAPTERGQVAGEILTHRRPADWVEQFADHLDHIRTIKERG